MFKTLPQIKILLDMYAKANVILVIKHLYR